MNYRETVAGNPPLFGVIKTDDRGAFIHYKPCGSGKTRKDIPNILRGRKLGQRYFVAAPNRVVAREIFQALQEFTELAGSCSLETSDATVTDLISPVLSPRDTVRTIDAVNDVISALDRDCERFDMDGRNIGVLRPSLLVATTYRMVFWLRLVD